MNLLEWDCHWDFTLHWNVLDCVNHFELIAADKLIDQWTGLHDFDHVINKKIINNIFNKYDKHDSPSEIQGAMMMMEVLEGGRNVSWPLHTDEIEAELAPFAGWIPNAWQWSTGLVAMFDKHVNCLIESINKQFRWIRERERITAMRSKQKQSIDVINSDAKGCNELQLRKHVAATFNGLAANRKERSL